MEQARARGSSTGAVLMGVGGGIAAIGSFLAWVKVSSTRPVLAAIIASRSVAGTSSGEGKAVLVMGVVAIAAAVLAIVLPRREVAFSLGIVVIVAALVVLFFTIRDIGQKDQQVHDALEKAAGRTFTDAQVQAFLNRFGISISLSTGIYLSMLGGLVMLGGGIATTAMAPKEDEPSYPAAPTYAPPAPPAVAPPTTPPPPDRGPGMGAAPT